MLLFADDVIIIVKRFKYIIICNFVLYSASIWGTVLSRRETITYI